MYRVNKKRSQAKNDVGGPSKRGTKVMVRCREKFMGDVARIFDVRNPDSGFKDSSFKVSPE
jgi:hypothetical protein